MQLTDNFLSASFPPWMSAEIELILRAAGVAERRPDSEPLARANAGPARDLDWAKIIDIARSHGVLALVARHLKARDWDAVPQSVVGQMEGYRTTLAARNLYFTRELLDVLGVLEAHGIAVLPYKGPALAAAAYGDIGLRPFGDLDIIVPRDDALAAKAVLQSVGYHSLTPRTDSQRVGGLPRGDYAFPLLSADRRVVVEVHWNLAPSLPLAFEDLIAGAKPLRLLDSTVSGMAPELLLLALCVHGTKHAWDRLEWICAVAHLVARRPPEDWDRLVEQSRSVGASRSLAMGLVLAGRLAATTVPPPVLQALGTRSLVPVARRVESDLFANGRDRVRYVQRFRVRARSDRGRYLLSLCRPTEKDREFVSLHRRLRLLYFAVRPLRVAHQRALGGLLRRWSEGARTVHARRARERQLVHQERKALALRHREEEVLGRVSERWERVRRRLERIGPGSTASRLLEVGSGAHGLVFGGHEGAAVGVDPLAAQYARIFPWQRTVPTVAAEGEYLPFADGTFGVVVCDNVVDHAEQPAAIVAEIARVLSIGGFLYFSVNVHHRFYALVSAAHRAWNAAGLRFEVSPFADHTVHLTPAQARALFDGVPLSVRWDQTRMAEARERARRRPLWSLRHLPARLLFKNARLELIAERVS